MLALLLIVLPLDLNAPAAPASTAGLSVTLALEPEPNATRFRITHRYSGGKPMRFVSGASDKSCEDPIDVLLVDGHPGRLSSNVPCGGEAFRSTQRLDPGGAWTINSFVVLKPGTYVIAARYCTTEKDLAQIDPAERKVAAPPWWFGCVDSPPGRIRVGP